MTFGHESWYNENYNTNINQMQIQNSKLRPSHLEGSGVRGIELG